MMLKLLAVLCGVCLAGSGVSWGSPSANEPGESVSSQPARAWPTNELQAAARRGVEWLVAQKEAMSLSFALKTFEKIHRATADDAIRKRMATLIREKCQEIPQTPPSLDPRDPSLRNWYALRGPVMDLIYQKSQGRPWKPEAANLGRMLAEHGDTLLPSRATLSERLVAAYQLRLLELPAERYYSNTLAEIRGQYATSGAGSSGVELMQLYACAHVVFTASGYYRRYLDPVEYAPEVARFSKAVEQIAARPMLDETWGDLASEILIARKLLRQPMDASARIVQRQLLAMQNADGSWGAGPVSNGKVHFTALATLAFMEFAAEFRASAEFL